MPRRHTSDFGWHTSDFGWHEKILLREMQVHYASMSIRERMKQARIPDCFEMARGEIEVRVRGGEPGA